MDNKQRTWRYCIDKEDNLRLKWFKTNETRLEEIANKTNIRAVPENVKTEQKQMILNSLESNTRKAVPPMDSYPPPVPPLREESNSYTMRPVDKETLSLLYSSTQNDGRMKYLTARMKLIPERRYYFTETSSFEYGWNMWDASKKMTGANFPREKIIENSFYRRKGVERDPDWYKEPTRVSVSVCGCI